MAGDMVGLIGSHQPDALHGDAVLLYTSGKRHAWPETLAPFFGGQVAA
jgi:glutamate racemase